MFHFVRTKNLPFSVEEARQMTNVCRVCAEHKPPLHKHVQAHLIKATQPFERLNIDFKGPLKSNNRNSYFLNVIDEYSRFPFIFPCKDVSTLTIIRCLCQLFAIFGMPAYVHSERGSSFMSDELLRFFLNKGITTSRTSLLPSLQWSDEKIQWYNLEGGNYGSQNPWPPLWHVDTMFSLMPYIHYVLLATNCSPHERLLKYIRLSSVGGSVPSWLITPGPVLLKHHVYTSKDDPLVDEVEVLQANPQYAHIRYAAGRETTLSIRHLVPLPEDTRIHDVLPAPDVQEDSCSTHGDELLHEDVGDVRAPEAPVVSDSGDEPLRRSVYHRQPPDRLNFKTWGE